MSVFRFWMWSISRIIVDVVEISILCTLSHSKSSQSPHCTRMCCNYLSTTFHRLCSIWSTLDIPLSFRHPDTCTIYTDDESLFLLRSLRWRRPPQPLREERHTSWQICEWSSHHRVEVSVHRIEPRSLFLEHRGNGKQYETTFRFGATYKAEPLYFRFRTVLLLWRWHEAVSRSAEPPTPTEWSQENSSCFLTRTNFFHTTRGLFKQNHSD